MNNFLSSSLLACLTALASATPQTTPAAPKPKPTPLPALEGVVKGPDGKPVEAARILARPTSGLDETLGTSTDASGRFRIALKIAVPHTVRIEARGLAARTLEKVQPGTPLTVSLQRGASIEGNVRDGATGAPVSGARVEAREQRARGLSLPWDPAVGFVEAVSDARGRYRIEGLAIGLHTVSASARGFTASARASVPTGSHADLYLFPGASVTGVVRDLQGRPIAGAQVMAEPEEPDFGGSSPRVLSTDARGRFDVPGLKPGSYTLVARRRGLAPGWVPKVVVEPGDDARADLVLTPGARVVGRLVGATERPVAGRVSVQETDGRTAPSALAESLRGEAGLDGRFAIDAVPPGQHVLAVVAPGHAPRRVEVEVRNGDAQADVGDVALETGLTIRGRVRDKARAPVAGASIYAYQRWSDLGTPAEARSEVDGSFVLAGLSPGAYQLRVKASGFGGVDREVDAGAENVELVLEPAGAILGTVTDEAGEPVESYRVTARAVRREGPVLTSPPRSASVGSADGRFTLDDVAEGTYVLVIAAPERASATVSAVRVTSGATTDVGRVRLGAGGVVRGSVSDATGAPVPGATLSVRGPGRLFGPVTPEATSDASGAFEVRGVPAGTVELNAAHPAFAGGRVVGLEVDPAKGPTEARVVLSRGGRVEGRVRMRDGTGIPGAKVGVVPLPRGGAPSFPDSGALTTASDGSFLAERIPSGPALVMLMSGVGQMLEMLESVQQREIQVREGETTSVEFASREILVTGRVTRSGAPLPNVRVRLRGDRVFLGSFSAPGVPAPPSGPQRLTGVTREDGDFELLVNEPGKFFVEVETLDGKLSYPGHEVQIPDGETHFLNLSFAGLPVAGVVVDKETEQGVPRVNVWAAPTKPGGSGGGSAVTRADGRFQLDVEPGEYSLRAEAEGYAHDEVELAVGSAGAPDVRLVLSRGESLSGRVVDRAGRSVGGLFVLATPESGDPRAGRSLPDGSFTIVGLAPQAYNLVARSDLGSFAFRPGVSPGPSEIVLTLRPAGRLLLRVHGPDGAPVRGAYATVARIGGARVAGASSLSTSDSEGALDIQVPAGSLEIRVRKDKLQGRATAAVAEGETARAKVTLAEPPPGGTP